jgi:hypothetical protein
LHRSALAIARFEVGHRQVVLPPRVRVFRHRGLEVPCRDGVEPLTVVDPAERVVDRRIVSSVTGGASSPMLKRGKGALASIRGAGCSPLRARPAGASPNEMSFELARDRAIS